MNGIPIDYVMCGVTGNYDSPWTNWENKLKIVSYTPEILSRMTTLPCNRFILSILAPNVLVPILSTITIIQIMVASVTRTLIYTFVMMLI